jgi:hypothetical protein
VIAVAVIVAMLVVVCGVIAIGNRRTLRTQRERNAATLREVNR